MTRTLATSLVVTVAAAAVGVLAIVANDRPTASTTPATGLASPADLDAAGTAALALVSYPPTRLDATVRFAPARPGVRAQADLTANEVVVYLRAGEAPHVVAHDIAHELGHLFDQRRMTATHRETYLATRGVAGVEWLPSGDSDYAVGVGDFAEVFALCYASSPEFRSELAPRPDNPCDLLPREAL